MINIWFKSALLPGEGFCYCYLAFNQQLPPGLVRIRVLTHCSDLKAVEPYNYDAPPCAGALFIAVFILGCICNNQAWEGCDESLVTDSVIFNK